MPLDNPYVSDWVTLNQILLSLYQDNKSLYELDSMDIVFIRELAYKCPAALGTANAQAILQLLYREDVPECPEYMSTKNTKSVKPYDFMQNITDKNNILLGDNYPEPAVSFTNIPYYLPGEVTGTLYIYDVSGKLISEYKVNNGENILYIDTKNLSPGLYTYTLSVEGYSLISKKMMIGK